MKLPFEIRNKSHRRSRFALLASTSIATSLWAAGAALAQNVSTPIPDVSVTAPNNTPGDGSTASGYRVDKVCGIGPFENLKIQDTPYTVNVISSDFIENTQSYATPDKVLEMMPGGVQYTYTSQRPVTGVANFRGSPTASGQQRIDGLPVASSSSLSFLEPFSRVEAISSVSGFMYGVGSSTGIFNYVLKRPLAVPFFADITTGVLIGTSPYAHMDVGGTTPDGRFGYRFNIVGQTGEKLPCCCNGCAMFSILLTNLSPLGRRIKTPTATSIATN